MTECIFTAVRKANRVLFRHYQEALSSTGVSIVQLSILRALERHGALSLSRLADDLAMERTSLYRTIEPLVESNAVQIDNADTGKSKIATLTAEGRKTIQRVMPYWAKAQGRVLEETNSDNLQGLHHLLKSISNLSA
jgi:DNA-binding MarR family transcriptional regulator